MSCPTGTGPHPRRGGWRPGSGARGPAAPGGCVVRVRWWGSWRWKRVGLAVTQRHLHDRAGIVAVVAEAELHLLHAQAARHLRGTSMQLHAARAVVTPHDFDVAPVDAGLR